MSRNEQDAENFIKEVITSLGCSVDSSTIVTDSDTDMKTLEIRSTDGRYLIGNDGETLSALNMILHRYMEHGISEGISVSPITVDINDFQKKKIADLKVKAHMMAERAKFFKSEIPLEPMNGYERRIVHTFLEKDKNIVTDSAGMGKDRHIVIKFVEDKNII